MELITTHTWNDSLWAEAELIYEQSFEPHSRKKTTIVRSMFEKRMCYLHLLREGDESIGMALTGPVGSEESRLLLIDYLAIRPVQRHRGLGQLFVEQLAEWARGTLQMKGLLIEAEAEPSADNLRRLAFWQSCGFQVTTYVHHYIWVPEPYQALYLYFESSHPDADEPSGEQLFHWITGFHRRAYQKSTPLPPKKE